MNESKAQIPPLRIGYTLSLTGPVAENAWSAKLAHELWQEDVNLRGGILGRRIELICYNDYGDPTLVSELYQRLLDDDHVDLVMGGYGTNTIAASLPLLIERNRLVLGLMGLGVNDQFNYRNYFAMIPTGPNPNAALTDGFFGLAGEQNPALKTVALLSADAEFSKNPVIGAKENASKYGLQIIYEKKYPLSTDNFGPYLNEIKAAGADVLFLCSYLQDSIGLIRALSSNSYHPKLAGGAMIGPQTTMVKTALGPLLNGIVNYEYWVPVPDMLFPGVTEMLLRYQAKAAVGYGKADKLGHYVAPLAYAQFQVIEQAISATNSVNDEVLSKYLKANEFETVTGRVRFSFGGEWALPRVLQVQFQNINDHNIETFRNAGSQVIVSPRGYITGSLTPLQ